MEHFRNLPTPIPAITLPITSCILWYAEPIRTHPIMKGNAFPIRPHRLPNVSRGSWNFNVYAKQKQMFHCKGRLDRQWLNFVLLETLRD